MSMFEWLLVGELALLILAIWLGLGDVAGVLRLIRADEQYYKTPRPYDPRLGMTKDD